MAENENALPPLLQDLLGRYRAGLPQVDAIFAAMHGAGMFNNESELDNDHIAIRAFNAPGLGIDAAANAFLQFGYERRDHYRFEAKKLEAYWFSPPNDRWPRVFISELLIEELSEQAQRILGAYLGSDDPTAIGEAGIFDHLPWSTPSLADYQFLTGESEYAAWTLCHGYAINHLTIAVHDLPEPHDHI
ncbi:MAG: 2-oxoadipate dioxygenase/decarboxylase family protein, partial [Gammaproteobacteria bacterium]